MRARSGEYSSTEPFLIHRTIYVLRPQYFATAAVHRKGRLPVWVNLVILRVRQSLPVCPDHRTFSESVGMSQRCRLCCKTLFAGRDTNFPSCRCDNRIIMWGTTSSCDELTGDFGGGPETTSIDDCRLFLSFCGKLVARHFGTFAMLSANKRLMHRSKIVRPTASL